MGRWLERFRTEYAQEGTCKTCTTSLSSSEGGVLKVLQVPSKSLFKKIDRKTDAKFEPLTDRQAHLLLEKYPRDLELWNRFWLFMKEQSLKGAPFDYVLACFERMETTLRRRE